MKLKRLLSLVLCITMVLSTTCFSAYAEDTKTETESITFEEDFVASNNIVEEGDKENSGIELISAETEYVAKVGDTSYTTIDEAVEAWTNGTTLTLLSDVTLSEVIELSSTEMHTLDLSTFTMTAATNKSAISIIPNGRSSASYALDIKADEENPGGISATGGSCIYSKGKSGVKDRPIIRIYGGNFTGKYAINHSGSNGTNCPQFRIYGGTFDQISTNRAMLNIYGGTFTKKNWISPDSSAYIRIEGGKFFDVGNNMMSALNADKWTYGTSKGNFDVNVYVDEEGYYVVTRDAIDVYTMEANATIDTRSTIVYSKANAEGLYYKIADAAVKATTKGKVTLYEPATEDVKTSGNLIIDMSDDSADYTGDVTLGGKNHTFTVVFDPEKPYEGAVTPYKGYALKVTETMGTIVTRTYSNEEAVAKIGDTYYARFEEALKKVDDGETIILLKDIELDNTASIDREISFTLDGNGKNIKASQNFTATDSALVLGNSSFDIGAAATRNYTIRNVVFDGWTTDHIIRVQGAKANIEGCTFINNAQSRANLALLSFTNAEPSVKDCVFENNTCLKCIDLGSWGVNQNIVVDNCSFTNNTCTVTGVIYLHSGNENGTFTNCEFVGNNVNTNGNGAVIYLGFNENVTVNNCFFKDNNVSGTSNRVAGALQVGALNNISENVFVNNKASINGAEYVLRQIVEAGYYHAGNLSSNYFSNGDAPVWGEDVIVEYGNYTPVIDDYYASFGFDNEGNVVLSDKKYILKDVILDFVDITAAGTEGEKVYNINITAPGKIINRLNSVDLSFVHTKLEGDTEFEIIASNPEVTINSVDNSKVRYEFHYNGKTNTTTDTAETITIGQVKVVGYGKFSFAVDTGVGTNAAHATKNEDNIVDTFVPGGNTELNYGIFDITDDDITDVVILVPTRELKINISFPNAIMYNDADYQDMTVTIVGGNVNEEIELGEEDTYTIVRNLPVNTTYTVTVRGAGYRTTRYTVTLTGNKVLNFWNNVLDTVHAKPVEEGTDVKVTSNFLAGDIVKDGKINIYDLSAVVSYFGTEGLVENHPEYAKYDLNRDGVIDSKDVAYVLVSWDK